MFRKTLLIATCTLLFACPSSEPSEDGGPTRDGGPGSIEDPNRDGGTTVTTPSFLASEKGSVRFKKAKRIEADFATALGLSEVCTELGQYSCSDFIHRITLGGVEAYVQGLNEPLPFTSVTTPLAVERMALFACRERVSADFGNPSSGRIFLNLPLANGALADVEAEEVAASIQRLYQRALLRVPTPDEVEHHRQLYRDIEADGQPNAARDWAVLSCHAVLTSMESLFY
ncbi:MAG: hypothetical protein RMA76_26265 [Deltaproteobacteria bacterium]